MPLVLSMTLTQFREAIADLVREVEAAVDADSEVTIDGFGCSAFEVLPAVRHVADLLEKVRDERVTQRDLRQLRKEMQALGKIKLEHERIRREAGLSSPGGRIRTRTRRG